MQGTQSYDVSRVLYSGYSRFQKIDVLESTRLGRVLLLDNMVMLTEKDEFVYHEMIAHVSLFVHPNPKKILVIGGGDGGTIRECLKHKTIESLDLVDIDEQVTHASLKYFPSISEKFFSDKVNCFFEDGVKFVQSKPVKYDVIIVDSTDPISVGEGLFTFEFYQNCFNLLSKNGILIAQSESPIWTPEIVKGISKKLRGLFRNVYYYAASIPTYPSGFWAFSFATKGPHPINDFNEKRYSEYNLLLRYYNKEVHRASFALPNFFRELVNEN
jgi:spermidine synthase